MRIIIDGMGGDNAPGEIVKGVVEALNIINDEIVIVGNESSIKAELKKCRGKYPKDRLGIKHASDVITNDDAPVRAIRAKKDSSMVIGITMVKNGEGDIFISAGNSGALMAGGLFILGRIQGIDRPAIASIYPILGSSYPSIIVDAGANAECKPNNLLEFGVMGSIYMEKVMGIKNPRVGLVNIGAEESKGSTLTKAAYDLISKSRVNFVGNVILKLTEGLAWNILKLVKNKFTDGGVAKMGALLLSGKMRELKSEFDYSEYGGAPILGVKGSIVKMHGSSNANAVKNTILKAIPYVNNNVVQIIQNSVEELEEITISE